MSGSVGAGGRGISPKRTPGLCPLRLWVCLVGTPELGRAGVVDSAAEGTHWLHRSCKFQETPCQPAIVGEGWIIHAGSLALGEQMCLPQGQPPKKVRTKVCLLIIKESFVRGPWRGFFWGVGGLCQRSLLGAHRCHCILLERRGEGAKPVGGGGAAGPSFLHFTASSQTQLLAAPERGWARRRWGPFPLEGWIEGAPPWGFPDDWPGAH